MQQDYDRTLYAERTLHEGIGFLADMCDVLDPLAPETRRLVERYQNILYRLDRQVAIDQSLDYWVGHVTRKGEPAILPPRLERVWRDLAARAQTATANSPPDGGKANAPADWYSTEAPLDLSA
jgi:hypothetical protein